MLNVRMARVLLTAVFSVLLIFGGTRSGLAGAPPIEIAIFPALSPKSLFEMFDPMRAALETSLNRPVYLNTAKDFAEFARRTQAGEFAYVITPAHLGRLAQAEAGYRPVLRMNATMRGAFLVLKDSHIANMNDLRGQSIATPDPLALATIAIKEQLIQLGIDPARDVRITALVSHNAAILSVLRGENTVAGVWEQALMRMPADVAPKLRQVGPPVELPMSSMLLAGPGQPASEVTALRQAIFAYAATPEGRAFMTKTAYDGVSEVDPEQFRQFDRYLPLVRAALGRR